MGRSAFFFFFLNIYYSHMDRNGKKIISDLEKIFFLVAAKQMSQSAMPNKLFFFSALMPCIFMQR